MKKKNTSRQNKVYEKSKDDLTFIGTDFHRIVDEKDIITDSSELMDPLKMVPLA